VRRGSVERRRNGGNGRRRSVGSDDEGCDNGSFGAMDGDAMIE
jgi:hypothetical protein